MTDIQPVDLGPEPEPTPQSKGSSGYKRLKVRHHNLIEQHDALKAELAERDEREAELQQSIDRLLAQHKRIMAEARTPQPWFDGAKQALASLAENPDRHAIEVFVTALAVLQRRIDPIVSRLPL
jgi:hypothetical protein